MEGKQSEPLEPHGWMTGASRPSCGEEAGRRGPWITLELVTCLFDSA